MKGKSILLALSGSENSRHATEVCWKLARRLGATITAHHVVDSHSAWEFLGHEHPGFLESGAYLEPYQQLVSSLFILGKELAGTYAREARAKGIDNVCLVDEGNPVTEICRRAHDHKIVVIGHQTRRGSRPRSQVQRLSVAEALAHECPRPLLIVQDECRNWSSLTVVVSPDHINELYINSCLDMALALDLPARILCLTGGNFMEKPETFVRDLRQSNRRLQEVPVYFAEAHQEIAVNMQEWFAPDGSPFDRELDCNTLLVIPTRMVAGERLTVLDSSPSAFVHFLKLPCSMLWPEEYTFKGLLADEPAALKSMPSVQYVR